MPSRSNRPLPSFPDLPGEVEVLDVPPAQTYTGVYGMHKYWSKKPGNVVRALVEKYSEPGEVVLDCFCGSGVTVLEVLRAGRRAVGVDVNPAAVFITRNLVRKVDPLALKSQFKAVERACRDEIDALYPVRRGGKTFTGTHFIWRGDVLEEVWYRDSDGRKVVVPAVPSDVLASGRFTYDDLGGTYPKVPLTLNSRVGVTREMFVHELFTPRNLRALAVLWDEIRKMDPTSLREVFEFCFTGALGQCSKMVFVIKNRRRRRGGTRGGAGAISGSKSVTKKGVGSWVVGYWLPEEHFEVNVWNCFSNRFKRVLRGKEKQFGEQYEVNWARDFPGILSGGGNCLLLEGSATEWLARLPPASVDYVFTDPPHGDRVPFLELSAMWNAWLGVTPDYEGEIVVSNSPTRGKGRDQYHADMARVFGNLSRVLKPNGALTLAFNSLDERVWEETARSLSAAGFGFENVAAFRYSAGSVAQDSRPGGLRGDFLLTLRKI
ncbi:MAG: DNA methyltransferase [Promethearchaeota archaeon]